MQYFLYILAIPFLYLNYKIIASDLKIKKIPNKYLGYLLLLVPFYYIYIFLNFPEINYLFFLLQIFLTFIISFILYYFNIWAAWDAKYLLVLSLFIPYIWIIPFIWNIALITLFYLFWYFIYFYFGKLVFNKIYRQSLWWNIKQDLSETWKVHKSNKGWKTYKIISKFLLIFFIIFVSIRLFRIYLFNSFLENWNSFILFREFIEKYNIYLIFLWIWIFIWWLYLFRILINKFKIYISEKLKLNLELVWNVLIWILFFILISFISYELINNYNEISSLLIRVFTLYLGLYLIFKILIYSYKITFGIGESTYINIDILKKGDMIDKQYLINIFWKQVSPYFIKENKWENIDTFIDPKKYFSNLDILIKKKDINIIKKYYKKYNDYYKKEISSYTENNQIRILNTFAFWIYLFIWFIITFLFQDLIFKYIINNIINVFY